jgi:hypothetical protein
MRSDWAILAVYRALAASERGLLLYKMAWTGGTMPVFFNRNLYQTPYNSF